jgi:hypothetical protein
MRRILIIAITAGVLSAAALLGAIKFFVKKGPLTLPEAVETRVFEAAVEEEGDSVGPAEWRGFISLD